eukprot:5366427-Pleurochrysis_carterae.AAC.1
MAVYSDASYTRKKIFPNWRGRIADNCMRYPAQPHTQRLHTLAETARRNQNACERMHVQVRDTKWALVHAYVLA